MDRGLDHTALNRRAFVRGAAILLATASTARAAGAQDMKLTSAAADSFVDFISVQTHLNWRNTVWEPPQWRKFLGDLGVRYTRSSLGNKLSRDHLDSLFSEYGIRSSATFNAINEDGSFDLGKTAKTLEFLKEKIGPEKVLAIEGPNEYTHKYKQGDWVRRLRDYQDYLHGAVKGDGALSHIDVLAPTIWKRIVEDYEALGDLGHSADYGNLHLYNAGRKPSRFNRDNQDEPIDTAIREARIVVPGKPICITETGFNVAADGKPTQWTIPPDVAAKYTLRNLAELFLRRDAVKRANIYTLIDDEHKDDHYGLLDASLSPRPAYAALKNVIALFNDPGTPGDPVSLPLAVKDAGEEGGEVRYQLFHKRDGRLLLMLWQDAESYDRQAAAAKTVKAKPVSLDFGRSVEAMRLFAPTISGDVQREMKAAQAIELQVPDHLYVLEMSV